ncbi:cupin domain-containing protein [Haloarcula nitratireducens]|uniref:Cupin domain-containing protein n=1 Tax=Haloarcula nitratireducens TaxID=2487749 RepID=A0AAW4PLX9_9EURY|nr:cupin domain-containing protein [Halomicroarcula nitratireducens]MBX0298295.1 cupin domain-containing protein [Halomicroarcula nitratireducens]
MKQDKQDVPVRIDTPDAVARQQIGFGDASEYGELSGEYFTFAAGTDITPLLQGLEDDLCQCPHWGYVLAGTLTASYADGHEEATEAGDLFYWPPGHTIRANDDSEIVMFSPQAEHTAVIDHIFEQVSE